MPRSDGRQQNSFRSYVQMQRLEHAGAISPTPPTAARHVGDIAFAVALNDSLISAYLQAEVGASPRDWRERATT